MNILSRYPYIALCFGVLGSGIVAYKEIFVLIFFFFLLDCITGIIVALKNKQYSSKIAASGVIKKAVTLLVLVGISSLCVLQSFTLGIDMLLMLYAGIEASSVIENLLALGHKDKFLLVLNDFLKKFLKTREEAVIETIEKPKKKRKKKAKTSEQKT